MTREVLSGNYAQAYAVRLARAQVISAYPITPQTSIVEKLSDFVALGELDAQFVEVESEHSALQVVVSAAGLGARTYTATSSQGLLLMHELLHWASGMRAPIVMGVVNRAVAPPWNIGADHTDTIAQRDTGWIQFYPESNQEVLDTVLEAYRLAELPDVRLPAMVNEDAFYLSHTYEPVDVPTPELVDRFLPPREGHAILKPGVAQPPRLVHRSRPLRRVPARARARDGRGPEETRRGGGGVPAGSPDARTEARFRPTVRRAPTRSSSRWARAPRPRGLWSTSSGPRVRGSASRSSGSSAPSRTRSSASSPGRRPDRRSSTGRSRSAPMARPRPRPVPRSTRPPIVRWSRASSRGWEGGDVTPAHVRRMFRGAAREPERETRWEDLAPLEVSVHG